MYRVFKFSSEYLPWSNSFSLAMISQQNFALCNSCKVRKPTQIKLLPVTLKNKLHEHNVHVLEVLTQQMKFYFCSVLYFREHLFRFNSHNFSSVLEHILDLQHGSQH